VTAHLVVVIGDRSGLDDRRLSWADLASAEEPDDVPVVVLDSNGRDGPPAGVVEAALAALAGAGPRTVVVSTRSVTDTLKVVDDEGTVLATADREIHRLVGPPVALRLGELRAVRPGFDPGPPTITTLLGALAAAGATLTPAARALTA
jgi:2-C-methyl-D-erythritol 4-phosphate cytidylyltransferase